MLRSAGVGPARGIGSEEPMECCEAVLVLVVVLPVGWAIGNWVLGPIVRAGQKRRLPPQYSITDFLCLFLLIQMPMALIHGYAQPAQSGFSPGGGDRAYVWLLDGYVWLACGALWWGSVRALSRAGIRNPWSRGYFLLVVLPVTLVGTVVCCCTPFWILFLLSQDAPQSAWLVLAGMATPVAFFHCGRYTRRIVAAAAPPDEAGASLSSAGPEKPVEPGGNPFRVESQEPENRRLP